MKTLFGCAHAAEFAKSKLVRSSNGARARLETLEAVKKLVREIGVGFGGERLGQ